MTKSVALGHCCHIFLVEMFAFIREVATFVAKASRNCTGLSSELLPVAHLRVVGHAYSHRHPRRCAAYPHPFCSIAVARQAGSRHPAS